ncbi:MAG TPA: hypothetical protein VE650_16700 [Acetobacteraceae bacterium]|jgi:hypothetical protein|nr:hypothetical protein [Acetobacteraceae bacterium]
MHTETFDFAGAGQISAPVRSTFVQRVVAWFRTAGVTYPLDSHLANDIGVRCYTVPLFPERKSGGRR